MNKKIIQRIDEHEKRRKQAVRQHHKVIRMASELQVESMRLVQMLEKLGTNEAPELPADMIPYPAFKEIHPGMFGGRTGGHTVDQNKRPPGPSAINPWIDCNKDYFDKHYSVTTPSEGDEK